MPPWNMSRVMRRAAILPIVVLIAAAAQCSTGVPEGLIGEWGGEHAGLIATAERATLEYDCASGTMDVPVRTDGDGRFEARGEHTRGHGGPVRDDEVPDRHPALYVGRIRGDVMTLTVTMTDLKETVGTFLLVRGAPPRVFKCL